MQIHPTTMVFVRNKVPSVNGNSEIYINIIQTTSGHERIRLTVDFGVSLTEKEQIYLKSDLNSALQYFPQT